MPTKEQNKVEALQRLLSQKLGSKLVESKVELGDVVVRIARADAADVFKALKETPELDFNLLVDVTAVDWMDQQVERYEVVYHFLSLRHLYRLRVKAWLPENDPSIATATTYWNGANFMERETWDMYGVQFSGNSDLRRLLLYEEFVGHPLRKDYPVQGKQPRIRLRSPEVRNTAVDMNRPPLVQIGKRGSSGSSALSDPRGMNRVIAAEYDSKGAK